MREIKFRQWLTKNKIFHYFGFIEDEFLGPISLDTKTNPVTQYTGIKDSKGVEIYEGDIVEAPYCFGLVEGYHCFGPGGWSIRKFTVSFDNLLGYQWKYWNMDKAVVIGNIYENPELLTKPDED